jgi:hypothetical protein
MDYRDNQQQHAKWPLFTPVPWPLFAPALTLKQAELDEFEPLLDPPSKVCLL